MASHNDLGSDGEQLAKQFLENSGYEILDENWVFKKSEIDLIAYKDSKIIFVEVKTRKNNTFAEPEDFVSQNKQKQMALAADEYIYLMNHQHQIRFDIISILFDKFGKPIIKHIEDAFWP
ncbi:YraN family protein [Daejeonella sp.]|jgi:putative endonuclease|uniref:YraN family protein n=1 Tax=Daejeonella sp. TaxID=2805397 RepID=UPI0025C6AFF2|nr:YraN family protein [Daejeonella sp.]